MMKIEEIKTGTLVMISSLIESEIDGMPRRQGAIGMVESPVFGTGGMWWWIIHQDGSQVKYRYCEISEMKTIKVPKNKMFEPEDGRGVIEEDAASAKEKTEEVAEEKAPVYGWVHHGIENWID